MPIGIGVGAGAAGAIAGAAVVIGVLLYVVGVVFDRLRRRENRPRRVVAAGSAVLALHESATDRLETPSELRKARREIARIKTLQRERELKIAVKH